MGGAGEHHRSSRPPAVFKGGAWSIETLRPVIVLRRARNSDKGRAHTATAPRLDSSAPGSSCATRAARLSCGAGGQFHPAMMAHSFIRPMPALSQQQVEVLEQAAAGSRAQSAEFAPRAGWLRSLGRGKGSQQQRQQPELRADEQPQRDAAPAPVDAPSVGTADETASAPPVIPVPEPAVPEPEPEPELEPFSAEPQPEPEVEPVTPRAGWCVLEEPATPDRVGRVRSGSTDERGYPGESGAGGGGPVPLVLSSLPRSSTVETDGKEHTVYTVELCYPPPHARAGRAAQRWSLERRYSEFAELHDSLAESLASRRDVELPAVPPSRWMGSMDPAFVSQRRVELESWLAALLSSPVLALQPQLHAFLETPDSMLVQLGMRDPPTPTPFPREVSPSVRGDEIIQQQRHYGTSAAALTSLTLPLPRARA